ncbi:hypothetical protein PHISCL_03360 [Aspergillus sclerotialis]|uniref:Uncharacterized protein n=1 Tax=Aspergillus sclerotialis TaxID=2070753 RepID=A0A3A3A2P3_9EURO|nr:hypothetical protein PHISCL_03360 [Aspergillus sclerotialis]
MECFRQIFRCIKSPFQRNKNSVRVLEIGAPTDFRKEELPPFFSDADRRTLASKSHESVEKTAVVSTAVEHQPSRREKIKHHVRRMSVKLPRPAPDAAEEPICTEEENRTAENQKAQPE